MDDEDFQQEVQDDPHTQHGLPVEAEKVLSVRPGQYMEWRGNMRQWREIIEHHGCRPEIKHWHDSEPHHLFMIDLVIATDSEVEVTPSVECLGVAEHEDLEADQGHRKGRIKYYDKREQLELVLAAQGLSEAGGHKVDLTVMDEEVEYGVGVKEPDIWQDSTCLALLKEGALPDVVELEEGKRARNRAEHCCWKEQGLFFKDLYVPRPEERRTLVVQMHEDLGALWRTEILS